MHMPLLSLLISSVILIVLVVVFRFEKNRGRRVVDRFRTYIDFWLLKIRHMILVRFRAWGTYMIRQVLQYLFHTLLRGSIRSLSALEGRLKAILRSNKTLAKKSDIERNTKNMLEEVALHKMEVALTEKEKRIRKQQSIEG